MSEKWYNVLVSVDAPFGQSALPDETGQFLRCGADGGSDRRLRSHAAPVLIPGRYARIQVQ